MGQSVNLTGMILVAQPIGDYDKRLVILTKERGKITAFAKGARRQNSALLAACNPFVFGEFTLYEGRTSYRLQQADISKYFTELASRFDSACYGFYFLEFADYYTREGNDEREVLKLLYVTLRALLDSKVDNRLIRYIFELKALVVNGEYPQMFCCTGCGKELKTGYFSSGKGGLVCENCCETVSRRIPVSESLIYTMQFIISSPLEKLYTFTVSDQVFAEVKYIMEDYTGLYVDKKFKSLGVLEAMDI